MLNLLYHATVDTLLAVTLVAYYRASDSNLNAMLSSIVNGYKELDQESRKLVGRIDFSFIKAQISKIKGDN